MDTVSPWVNPVLALRGRTTHLHKPLINFIKVCWYSLYKRHIRKSISAALCKEVTWSETSGYSLLHKCVSMCVGVHLYICMGVYRICSACMWILVCVHVYYLLLFFQCEILHMAFILLLLVRGE